MINLISSVLGKADLEYETHLTFLLQNGSDLLTPQEVKIVESLINDSLS